MQNVLQWCRSTAYSAQGCWQVLGYTSNTTCLTTGCGTGRDNFLATEADKALSALWAAVSESRAVTALMTGGMQHKSPHVRCRAAAHLDEVAAGGAGLEGLVRGNWSLLERVFK